MTLDPRRAVYISSLRAVVCAGVIEGMQTSIANGLKDVLKRVDGLLDEYCPDFFVVLGASPRGSAQSMSSAMSGMARRWSGCAKIQVVARGLGPEAQTLLESSGCEAHNELVWGQYRFTDSEEDSQLELQLMTIAGAPNYGVRTGNRPFGGLKLPVFLKSVGRLTLPSSDPRAPWASLFKRRLERSDVFAVGHQRVLPLGKAGELKSLKGIARGLPISKATLSARRKAQEAISAD